MNHYGKPLSVVVKNGELRICIGVHVLAHSASYADWANPFDEAKDDYIRTFAITDPAEFARDVKHAMEDEREDGSTPLSDFLDAMMQAALDDGSMGAEYDDIAIKHGENAPCEKWANGAGKAERT